MWILLILFIVNINYNIILKNVKYLFTLEEVVVFSEISICSKFFSRSVYFFCNKYSMI